MSDDASRTLFHPFETGLLDMPEPESRILFLGARPGFRLPQSLAARLTCVQGFRPDFLGLQRHGHHVIPEPDGDGYDLALVLCSRHRGENEARIAEALHRVKLGGSVVVAATKGDGGDSLRKRIDRTIGIDDHASKYHGVVFWLTGNGSRMQGREPEQVDGFITRPGMFSFGRVDPGSLLLAENLPSDLSGDVADFCAGWGWLTKRLTAMPSVQRIDLYEADHASVEAARGGLPAKVATRFFWHDLVSEPVEHRYDAIVMNPPFHASGHKADPGIGETMIRASARALRPSGRLFLVANRPLPYEAVLAECFAASGEITRNDAFKILWGQRPKRR